MQEEKAATAKEAAARAAKQASLRAQLEAQLQEARNLGEDWSLYKSQDHNTNSKIQLISLNIG